MLLVLLFAAAVFARALFRQARAADVLAGPERTEHVHRLMPIWAVFVLGLLLHVGLTTCLPAQYNPFDPLMYFHKAVWLAEKGTYHTGTPFWELDRLPGYPLHCRLFEGLWLPAETNHAHAGRAVRDIAPCPGSISAKMAARLVQRTRAC